MSGVRIIGTGSCLASRAVDNETVARLIGRAGGGATGDEWIVPRTGIRKRHLARRGELSGQLAYRAAVHALEMAGVEAREIECIRLATITPGDFLPFASATLQELLGVADVGNPFSDQNAACSGFVYGLQSVVAEMLWCGYRYVLLVGAETLSHGINWQDRSTAVLFGDGAGAAVLENTGRSGWGVLKTKLGGNAKDGRLFTWRAGGRISMIGNAVFPIAVRRMVEVSVALLAQTGYDAGDVDLVVAHQANERIIDAMAERLGVSAEKVVKTVGEHGNTSAASIPLALDVAVRQGRLNEGMLVLLTAFGGGITWGAALIRW